MSTDFPAPLSPARAVTLPGGTVKLTRLSARTGPEDLAHTPQFEQWCTLCHVGTPCHAATVELVLP